MPPVTRVPWGGTLWPLPSRRVKAAHAAFAPPQLPAALADHHHRSPGRSSASGSAAEAFVTVDTEFIRERTYWPELCVVQLAGDDEVAVIDAQAPGYRPGPARRAARQPGGDEGVPRRAAGHRDLRAEIRRRAAPAVRHPGRRHGGRLRRPGRLRGAGRRPHRRLDRQGAPLQRLVGPAALRRADRLRRRRRHLPARGLPQAVRAAGDRTAAWRGWPRKWPS